MEDLELSMKVSDFIASRLAYLGVDTCFTVTGGGAMHLNDSFGNLASYTKIYNHHEQASAMGAEGYARVSGKPAVVVVTTGPGALNTFNGVFGAYTDSIPMIVIAGQVKVSTISTEYAHLDSLRQLGDQEARSMEMIGSICKFSSLITDPCKVLETIDRAFDVATSGRPGPVWIEVPVDVQAMEINDSPLQPFQTYEGTHSPRTSEDTSSIAGKLLSAKRPVIIAGSGIRISNTREALLDLAEITQTPVVTAWTHDVFDNNHPLFAGRPGTIGTRPGNFVVQNADYVLVLGSRLNIRQVSYAWESFAKNAFVDWIEIDEAELAKPFPKVNRKVEADLRVFLPELIISLEKQVLKLDCDRGKWVKWCQEIQEKYSPKVSEYISSQYGINPYHFIFEIQNHVRAQDIFVLGNASACIIPYQILKLGPENRMFSNSGSASMGWDLPAAIGAAAAGKSERVICIAGDGSIMMNIQELATFRSMSQDQILIILDNGGYLSIKQTQSNFFGRESGASVSSGLHFPNFVKVLEAFDIPTVQLTVESNWQSDLSKFMSDQGPRALVVKLDQSQEFQPRLKSKMISGVIQTPELDDMFPHLETTELEKIRDVVIELA